MDRAEYVVACRVVKVRMDDRLWDVVDIEDETSVVSALSFGAFVL